MELEEGTREGKWRRTIGGICDSLIFLDLFLNRVALKFMVMTEGILALEVIMK